MLAGVARIDTDVRRMFLLVSYLIKDLPAYVSKVGIDWHCRAVLFASHECVTLL